ncbi:MAG: IS200/IS605 family transposase [Ignavibacteria bacterium]|jgi:REP element-mobilizing transposase RayT
MANTYTQLFVHIIFSTGGKEKVLLKSFREELFKYISGIINQKGQKSLAVNGTIDHIHIFAGIQPTITVADLVRDVKHSSTNFIKEKGFIRNKFNWQKGYGAFTYSKSQKNDVIKYIMNQEEHHKRKTFEEEYLEFLDRFEIVYDEKYVFG